MESLPAIGLTTCQTEAGWVGLVASPHGLLALEFPPPTEEEALANLQARWPNGVLLDEPALEGVKAQLRRYYAGKPVAFEAELDLEGHTPFQIRVWQATQEIPYGQTRSYSWLAERVGSLRAFRAVGQAMARNPIPIIIPCHRVLRKDGSLGGFGGGLDMKRRLLEMEAQGIS